MTDDRWGDIEDDFASSVRHFGNAVRLHDAGGFEADDLDGYRAEMALMHAMQSGHTSAEAGLRRLMVLVGEDRPVGEDWHMILIRRMSKPLGDRRPALLPDEVAADLQETRSFRHRAAHGYDGFDRTRLVPALEAAKRLSKSLLPALHAFRRVLDPR